MNLTQDNHTEYAKEFNLTRFEVRKTKLFGEIPVAIVNDADEV